MDALLQSAATWEPPDGYVLRVIAASRADDQRTTLLVDARDRQGLLAWARARLSALAARRDGAVWVMRQYWLLFRGR